MAFLSLGTVTVAFCVFILIKYLTKKRCRIPGPRGLPFIGNAFQVDKDIPQLAFETWAKQYGAVYRVKFFGDDIVVANSDDAIREVLIKQGDVFGGRPSGTRREMIFDDLGPAFSPISDEWSLMKKESMVGLRMTGEGLLALEHISTDIINDFIQEAFTKSDSDGAFDPRSLIEHSICDITASVVFGERLSRKLVHDLCVLDQDLSIAFTPFGEGTVIDVIPLSRYFLPKHIAKITTLKSRVVKLYDELINHKIADRKNGKSLTSTLDHLFNVQEKLEKQPASTQLLRKNIDSITRTLFAAGILTTSSALYSLLEILASKPEVQEKGHQQVIEAIGDKAPKLADRSKLPFVESMIFEALRFITQVPLSLPHATMTDTNLNGMFVPKGTQVITNLWHLHKSAEYWDDPDTFKADRFLNENGQLLGADHIKRKRLLPFGAGRRVCAGEALARNRLFLFMTSILQRCVIKPADGVVLKCDPRNEFEAGIVTRPKPFKVKFETRH